MRLTLNEQGLNTLALLIAESEPKAKALMARLVMNLIADDIGGASEREAGIKSPPKPRVSQDIG
jgi:hypothetical protein|tara:strand:+ start:1131 stop:1322 length:192 start_codon:yes stop_codon:yes gene_type:complete